MLLTNVELYVILYIPNEREENKMKVFLLGYRTIINMEEIAYVKRSGNIVTVYLKSGYQISEHYKDEEGAINDFRLLYSKLEEK